MIEKVAQTLLPDQERATYVQRQSAEKSEPAATPLDVKELRPVAGSGGGGNRTRVRKPLVTASTCLSGEEISHLSNLPSRAGNMLAWIEFRTASPPGEGQLG